jgi:hypothetical protein
MRDENVRAGFVLGMGALAQCISFFFSMPFLYLLRREFVQRSVI